MIEKRCLHLTVDEEYGIVLNSTRSYLVLTPSRPRLIQKIKAFRRGCHVSRIPVPMQLNGNNRSNSLDKKRRP